MVADGKASTSYDQWYQVSWQAVKAVRRTTGRARADAWMVGCSKLNKAT